MKKEVKKSLIEGEKYDNAELNKKASKLEKYEDVAVMISSGNQHPECLK